MKRTIAFAALMGVLGGLGGWLFGWWALAVTVPVSVGLGTALGRHNERRRRVADRQAREDRGDPRPGEGAEGSSSAYARTGSVSDDDLEHISQAEPLRGWKAATLVFHAGTFCFGPITGKQPYTSEAAEAQCDSAAYFVPSLSRERIGPKPHYYGPVLGCSCGFYAWKDRASVDVNGLGVAVLEVDLYGTVIECETGYRAGKQRVLSAEIGGRCFYCSQDASVVGLIGEGIPLVSARLFPLCIAHSGEARVSIERDELGSLLGTEVRWAEVNR